MCKSSYLKRNDFKILLDMADYEALLERAARKEQSGKKKQSDYETKWALNDMTHKDGLKVQASDAIIQSIMRSLFE